MVVVSIEPWMHHSAWAEFLRDKEDPTSNPFSEAPLGLRPVALYSETTAPLPSASMAGSWTSYPSPLELALHLRFAVLPHLFGIWLCRSEWEVEDGPMEAGRLFVKARRNGSRYADDIPLMEKIIGMLDGAIAPNGADRLETVVKACALFDGRWSRTGTWNFRLIVFPTLDAVARDVVDRASSEAVDMDDDAWIDLANRATTDDEARRKFQAILADCMVY